MVFSISVAIDVPLLYYGMIAHLRKLYYEFHSHSCGPCLLKQLRSVHRVSLYSSLLTL